MSESNDMSTPASGESSSGNGQLRGFARILAREVSVSDLLQELTTRDPAPWAKFVGWTPTFADREMKLSQLRGKSNVSGIADLVLQGNNVMLPVEVKLGHALTSSQADAYEAATSGRIILAGLALDAQLVEGRKRWDFVDLEALFSAWNESSDVVAAHLAKTATDVFEEWNSAISGTLGNESTPLSRLSYNFLGRAVTRKIASDLQLDVERTYAGVTSGGGLPIVQAWVPVPQSHHLLFIAEVRWETARDSGALRFGVDSWAEDSPEVRADCWRTAVAMDRVIRADALHEHIHSTRPDLANCFVPSGLGRKPLAEKTWDPVVARGFRSAGNPDGLAGGRRRNNPGFLGDGTRRFQAKTALAFTRTSGIDLEDIMNETLRYLSSHVSDGDVTIGGLGVDSSDRR